VIGIVRILIRETVEKPAVHPAKVEEMTTACRNPCKSATGLADLYFVLRSKNYLRRRLGVGDQELRKSLRAGLPRVRSLFTCRTVRLINLRGLRYGKFRFVVSQ